MIMFVPLSITSVNSVHFTILSSEHSLYNKTRYRMVKTLPINHLGSTATVQLSQKFLSNTLHLAGAGGRTYVGASEIVRASSVSPIKSTAQKLS